MERASGAGVRGALARLAREAAVQSHEVVALNGERPGARTVDDRGQPAVGVACVAEPGGLYEVTLYLTVRPVSVPQLAKRLRDRVRGVASQNGLEGELGAVNIVIADVVTEEVATQ